MRALFFLLPEQHYVQIGRPPSEKQISWENRMEAFEKNVCIYTGNPILSQDSDCP